MEIVLYNCTDDERKISKSLSNGKSVNVFLKSQNTSNIGPSFIFSNINDIDNYNYVFYNNMYYYIRDVVIKQNNVVEVNCEIDHLMSYKDDILACECILFRGAEGNPYIVDGDIPIQADARDVIIPLSNDDVLGNYTGSMEYVLVVAGREGE